MKILNIRTIRGPNIYHYNPVLVMQLDLETWAETASNEIPGFNKNLLAAFPGLLHHTCSTGDAGGFVERLERGTYPAHITEHLALEIANLAGMDIRFGKSRYAGAPGVYNVVVRYKNEAAMKLSLETAVKVMQGLLQGTVIDIAKDIEHIKEIISETSLGPSTQAILQAAKKRNIPYRHFDDTSLVEFGYGKNVKRIQTAVTSGTNLISSDIAQDKEITKLILEKNILPVCHGFTVSDACDKQYIREQLNYLRAPYAVKPLCGNHGRGVSLNLNSFEEVADAIAEAQKHSSKVLIEEMAKGRDYRLLLVDYKLVAAAERQPACVTGNGVSTILKLIEVVNVDPKRKEGHSGLLTKIKIDDVMLAHLRKQGLSLESIPERDQVVFLRDNANLSTGGTATDVTALVHPQVRKIAERAARVIGLDICGIDLIHDDIRNEVNDSTKIIEMNAGPGLRMHLTPDQPEKETVGDYILDMLYPNPEKSRIPIMSVTGTNGKTTVTRLLEKVCGYAGSIVGMTSSDGIWIGGERVADGDTTGPKSAEVILSDPSVEYAVLETARGGILKGLAYDWSDGAVITNIQADHFGQDGIECLDDIARIKSLVLERVKEDGFIVANADDSTVMKMINSPLIKSIPRKIILFSMNSDSLAIYQHRSTYGTCYWIEEGEIYRYSNGRKEFVENVEEFPITLRGTVKFQVANILASLAAGEAMGFQTQRVLRALKTFSSNKDNLGRFNIYQVQDKCVILDYAHNPDAISAMGETLSHYQGFKPTAVFGLPGDRSDQLIVEASCRVAENFSHIIIREDDDLRERKAGEVATLIESEVAKYLNVESCEKVLDTREAIKKALTDDKHKFVVIFYEDFKPAIETIRQFDPITLDNIPFSLKARSTDEREFANVIPSEVNVNTI